MKITDMVYSFGLFALYCRFSRFNKIQIRARFLLGKQKLETNKFFIFGGLLQFLNSFFRFVVYSRFKKQCYRDEWGKTIGNMDQALEPAGFCAN